MVIFQDTLTKRLIEHLFKDTLSMCADCLLPLKQLYLAVQTMALRRKSRVTARLINSECKTVIATMMVVFVRTCYMCASCMLYTYAACMLSVHFI